MSDILIIPVFPPEVATASDEFVLLAARGEFGDELIDMLQQEEPEIEEHLAAAVMKSGKSVPEFMVYLKKRVALGEYNDHQLTCIAPRLRELIDPTWERPEMAALRAELTEMAQSIVDELGQDRPEDAALLVSV